MLVSYQAVPLTFYNKIALMRIVLQLHDVLRFDFTVPYILAYKPMSHLSRPLKNCPKMRNFAKTRI